MPIISIYYADVSTDSGTYSAYQNALNEVQSNPESDMVKTMAKFSIDTTVSAISGVGDILAPGSGTLISMSYEANRDKIQDNIFNNPITNGAGDTIYNNLHGTSVGSWLGL